MNENLIRKYQNALNTIGLKWCGKDDAFTFDQAARILESLSTKGERAEVIVARSCEVAYGPELMTAEDAALVLDDKLRNHLRDSLNLMSRSKEQRDQTLVLAGMLLMHWQDLQPVEKSLLTNAVLAEMEHLSATLRKNT